MTINAEREVRDDSSRRGAIKPLRDIHGGQFTFKPNLKVSHVSIYEDAEWNWVDESDEFLEIYEPYRLSLDWQRLRSKYDLTEEIIEDLKKYTYLRLFHAPEVFPISRAHGNAHPATVVNEVSVLVLFLGHLRRQMSGEGYSLINKLSDIEAGDLDNVLTTYSGGQHETLKKVLLYLFHPMFVPLLDCGPCRLNQQDVRNMPWKVKVHEPYGRLSDELFKSLSNFATADVKQFLQALGQELQDKTRIGEGENLFTSKLPNFEILFKEYAAEREALRASSGAPYPTNRYFNWIRKNKASMKSLRYLIDRARAGAQSIIALYTGARLSELNGFKVGCLRKEDDGWVIIGTVIKQRRSKTKLQDKWVAIPIVRDAVKVLEQTGRIVGNKYLYHAEKEGPRYAGRMGSSGFRLRFHRYLIDLGLASDESKIKIHAHMFRHTLIFQLRRAGLNLPFITFQLKHRYDAAQRKVSNVTLGYGGLGYEAAREVVEAANYEAIRQIFHPDAPIAGGGAEQLRTRRAAYFAGMAVPEIEAVLQQLASQDMALVDVGMGLCQGQRMVVVDGVKDDPPCIGGLRCNPVRCSNGIIPEYKLPWWRRSSRENHSRAEEPEFAHAKSFYREAADEADAVIRFLEEQAQKKARDN